MTLRRGLLVAGLSGLFVLGLSSAASAHPLGNFTVNTADRVLVRQGDVQVLHVVDTAEIPTLQLQQAADGPDADHDGTATPAELSAYAGTQCGRLAGQVSLTLDGTRAPLHVSASAASFRPGQAGLPTSRLECTFDSDRAARSTVALQRPDLGRADRLKEVSATALCGRLTGTGSLPAQSPSALLTAYPQDLLSSPLDVTRASFGVAADAGTACRVDAAEGVPAPSAVLPRGVDRITTSYTAFVGRQHLTIPVALVAVLLSIALGCGHAVAPGHGKTVIAAYLVGQRGTKRQALWLGATVTATHTAGVLLLGALLSLTAVAAPERFVPATEVASGVLLGGVGVFLLRRALRSRGSAGHGHDHGPHDHGPPRPRARTTTRPTTTTTRTTTRTTTPEVRPAPELVTVGGPVPDRAASTGPVVPAPRAGDGAVLHSHGGRLHSHLPEDDAPLGWKTLATMGIAGGLVPSPSALVVLLGASALGRPLFGALLVVGYGIGMALTLTVAGLLLLRAQAVLDRRGWLSGRGARVVRVLPVVTAGVVLVVGAVIVLRGLLTFSSLG